MTETEFLPLFDLHHNMVYRLALSCTHSPQDAEDIVQTVFLKLLDSKHPPTHGKERAWLAQVTVNACRDLLRSRSRQRWEPLEETIPCARPEEHALLDAVLALPPKYRAAVHLHYYEGYSYDEIARILRISPPAVSMRLHRARNMLRSSLEEDKDGT
ncbi:MAG: RNA polymerase sigma factor [Bacillota bacterium]|nr:RNA polymerase sigma factor [Bacillota bacterium]